MSTNNFKLFDENKSNILSDAEYNVSTQRLNGVQNGIASSSLNNKFAYQVSLVAYAIAQLMNANGLDASDTLSVSAFVGNLQGAILQKVVDKATTAEAAAGVLSNKYITPETMKAAALLLSGGVMSGVLDMNGNRITNVGTPAADGDSVNKQYVDNAVRNVPGDLSTDGFHHFGNFVSDGGDNPIYSVSGLAGFLSQNIGKVSQIVVKFNNVKFNILLSNGYKRYYFGDYQIFNLISGTTGEFELNDIYYLTSSVNPPKTDDLAVTTNTVQMFQFDLSSTFVHADDVTIRDKSYNKNAIEIVSGAIELWYK